MEPGVPAAQQLHGEPGAAQLAADSGIPPGGVLEGGGGAPLPDLGGPRQERSHVHAAGRQEQQPLGRQQGEPAAMARPRVPAVQDVPLRLRAVPLLQRPAEDAEGQALPAPGGAEEDLPMRRQLQRPAQLLRRGQSAEEADPLRLPAQASRHAPDALPQSAVLHRQQRPPLGPDALRQRVEAEHRRALLRQADPVQAGASPLQPVLGPFQAGAQGRLVGQGQETLDLVQLKQLRHDMYHPFSSVSKNSSPAGSPAKLEYTTSKAQDRS